jgi:hypothetical protein
LIEEAKDKKKTELAVVPNGMTAKGIPEQDNYCDCGVFVLGYMEEFLKNPDETVRKLLQKEEIQWDMSPSKIRNDLRDLIFTLQKEHQTRLNLEKEKKRKTRKQKLSSKEPEEKAASPIQSPLPDVSTPPEAESLSEHRTEKSTSHQSPSPDLSTPVNHQKERGADANSPALIEKLKGSSGSDGDTGAESFYSAPSSPKNGDDDPNVLSSEEVAQSVQEIVKLEKKPRQRDASPAFVDQLSSPSTPGIDNGRGSGLVRDGQVRPRTRKLLSQSMRGSTPKKPKPKPKPKPARAGDDVVLVESIE